MRVLFLTDSLSDLDGVGRYAVRLISAMEAREPGLEVRILLARKHRPTSSEVPAHWKVEVGLPPDYFFYMSRARFWASLAAGVMRVRRAAHGGALVHAIKDYPHNLVGLLGARLAGVPCIATAHGTYTVQPLVSARHAKLARWAYARFAAMISVSRFTARRLGELLGDDSETMSRVRVIPNAVDAEHYVAKRELGARPWRDVRYTLGIGELKERKGHHLALAAWCNLAEKRPDLHHFLVGKGSRDEYHRSLLEMVAARGLGRRVHFLGNVSEDEKVDLLQHAEAFVHTPVMSSDGGFEGFGLVYLEASASGTACLGTRGCGAEDAILDGVTGLLVEPELESVERGLARLLDERGLRESMRSAGREHARRCSWEKNAAAVLDVYREVTLPGARA